MEEKLSKATINNCDDLANEKRKADEQIVVIEAELKLREKHFETAVKEQHKRRHDALQAKLQARKDAKETNLLKIPFFQALEINFTLVDSEIVLIQYQVL